MKQLLCLCGMVFAITISTHAATLVWGIDGFDTVYQIVADGKGGCAVVGVASSAPYIVWLDSAGNIVYQRTLTVSTLGIVAFDGKNLVYHLATSPMTLVTVDKKGTEKTVSDPAYHLFGAFMGMPYQPNRPFDKKGFFTAQAPTGSGTWRVARYSYK